jgi:hypothetical protein
LSGITNLIVFIPGKSSDVLCAVVDTRDTVLHACVELWLAFLDSAVFGANTKFSFATIYAGIKIVDTRVVGFRIIASRILCTLIENGFTLLKAPPIALIPIRRVIAV